jgi:hypothetical protein
MNSSLFAIADRPTLKFNKVAKQTEYPTTFFLQEMLLAAVDIQQNF